MPRPIAGCVGFWHLGANGVGTQPDWSGNANAGTVTGATVSDHVPLGPWFGYDLPRFSRIISGVIARARILGGSVGANRGLIIGG
jgi:hypothetical protein